MQRLAMTSNAHELALQDGDHLKIMGAIFAVLFVLAAPGLTFWPVAMVFLIFACLALAMIVKAPLPWPVRAVFLAILASALLLQGAMRTIQARGCDSETQQVAPGSVPSLGATVRGLNPFEYSGCPSHFSSD